MMGDDDDDDHLSSECRIYRLRGLSQFESILFPVSLRISVRVSVRNSVSVSIIPAISRIKKMK